MKMAQTVFLIGTISGTSSIKREQPFLKQTQEEQSFTAGSAC
jgi:hypothetical protein